MIKWNDWLRRSVYLFYWLLKYFCFVLYLHLVFIIFQWSMLCNTESHFRFRGTILVWWNVLMSHDVFFFCYEKKSNNSSLDLIWIKTCASNFNSGRLYALFFVLVRTREKCFQCNFFFIFCNSIFFIRF